MPAGAPSLPALRSLLLPCFALPSRSVLPPMADDHTTAQQAAAAAQMTEQDTVPEVMRCVGKRALCLQRHGTALRLCWSYTRSA